MQIKRRTFLAGACSAVAALAIGPGIPGSRAATIQEEKRVEQRANEGSEPEGGTETLRPAHADQHVAALVNLKRQRSES